jgi:hypothetical protein
MVVIVLVIFGVGVFGFIKPMRDKMKKAEQQLATAQSDWDMQLREFDRIDPIQKKIERKHKEGTEFAEKFTDEMTDVELDEFLRNEFINTEDMVEDEAKVRNAVTLNADTTSSVSYYYYTPNIVTYPLFEYADMDGSLADAIAAKMHDSDVLSKRAPQTVGAATASLVIQMKKENLMNLLDRVDQYAKSHNDAMMITSVTIEDFEFNKDYGEEEGAAKNQPQLDEEGNPIENAAPNNDENADDETRKDYSNVTINYKALYVQEPTKPELGDKYDPTIWDGNEWKDVVFEGETTE